MATRRPLVRYADTGQIEELRSGDDVPGGGGGGSGTATQVTLNVLAFSPGYEEIVVTDASVSPTSKIIAVLVGELDAENDLEELQDTAMQLSAVPETGQIRFVLTGNSQFTGVFKVNYQVFL